MASLFLLRHAKAGWSRPGMKDFDRGLDQTGKEEIRLVSGTVKKRYERPQSVTCSTAMRARQTWAIFAGAFACDPESAVFSPALYGGDAPAYVSAVEEQPAGTQSLLMVGHNPMMEDLAHLLIAGGDANALAALRSGFPTCGLAVLSLECEFEAVRPRCARLEAFLTPAGLRAAAL
ncbi:MAG: histidine phosphatase family protein [Rhizobiaceae bacterium]|nr:MAG: histidine phosphatase family protein [Rhizobiaceae bacterium]